jgi:hypothetical protein
MHEFLCQVRPGLEHVAAAGDELALVALDVRERPESVHLRLEHPIGMKGSGMRSRDMAIRGIQGAP